MKAKKLEPIRGRRGDAQEEAAPAKQLGAYRLGAIVRTGAMFVTFAATHTKLGHAAWITTTPLSIEPTESGSSRLLYAARIAAALRTDAAVAFLEVIEEEGRVALVTRAPQGTSFRELMQSLEGRRDIDVEARAAVGLALARGVAELHDAAVAHLALSPDVAFFDEKAVARLAGLELAKALDQEAPAADRDVPDTGPEERYRSPERITGQASDRTADVFSLGVMVYELVSGKHPFAEAVRGETLARRIRSADPEPLEAPSDIQRVVQKCLQKAPSLRYESARRVADDLTLALGGPKRVRELLEAVVAKLRGRPDVAVSEPLEHHEKKLAKWLAILAGGMALTGLFVVGGEREFAASGTKVKGASSAEVRVLARPWADIYVDGERVETTPIARPIVLSPGRHEIILRHPRAPDERRLLDLEAGERITVDVEMSVARAVDAGVDPSP